MLLLGPSAAASAQTCSKQSPPHTVALLELYTSEGCSSCPPADKFVSNLRNAGLPAEQVVPLALHVDYWDYIGWKDLFASHAYTQRQRWLSGLANTRTIYTPEIFVAGREVRDWIGPIALSNERKDGKAALPRALAVPAGAAAKNLGVAAFIQTDSGEGLQALSLPLCNG